jgi:hypothetical protein
MFKSLPIFVVHNVSGLSCEKTAKSNALLNQKIKIAYKPTEMPCSAFCAAGHKTFIAKALKSRFGAFLWAWRLLSGDQLIHKRGVLFNEIKQIASGTGGRISPNLPRLHSAGGNTKRKGEIPLGEVQGGADTHHIIRFVFRHRQLKHRHTRLAFIAVLERYGLF